MKRFLGVAIFLALLGHAAVMLFGGLVINAMKQKQTARIEEVEILQEEKKEEEKPKEDERDVKKVEKIEDTPEDQMPDTTVLEEMDTASAAPALEAVSLADLESALTGGGGASDSPAALGSAQAVSSAAQAGPVAAAGWAVPTEPGPVRSTRNRG
jgi:predicted phage gp36 major capsid-like protein